MSDTFNTLNVKGDLLSGVDQIEYETTLGASATSVTISGLDGDTDLEYYLDIALKSGSGGSATFFIRPNNDTSTSNYGLQDISGQNTMASARRITSGFAGFYLSYSSEDNNEYGKYQCFISAKSGVVRICVGGGGSKISGTTIDAVQAVGSVWNNTAANITSLVVVSGSANGLGVGTIIRLKSRRPVATATANLHNSANAKSMTAGVDTIVYETTLTGTASSITVSGLDGDTDLAYRVIGMFIADGNAGDVFYVINGDTTNANYGGQTLHGINSSVSASRPNVPYVSPNGGFEANKQMLIDWMLHAKTGTVRTGVTSIANNITGTTVGEAMIGGLSWNNTSSNITSLGFRRSGINFAAGSYICVLRPSRSTTTANAWNSFGTPMGQLFADCFETVAEGTLTGDSSGITISGLTGDTDILYELEANVKMSVDDNWRVRFNNDSGTGYARQILKGAGSTASASRTNTGTHTGWTAGDAGFVSNIGMSKFLIYAKQGYVRTALGLHATNISGTTVSNIFVMGHMYSTTNTELTSLVLNPSSGSMQSGTYYRLKALKRKV